MTLSIGVESSISMRQGGINRQSVRVGGRVAGEGHEEKIPGPSQPNHGFSYGDGTLRNRRRRQPSLIALACQN